MPLSHHTATLLSYGRCSSKLGEVCCDVTHATTLHKQNWNVLNKVSRRKKWQKFVESGENSSKNGENPSKFPSFNKIHKTQRIAVRIINATRGRHNSSGEESVVYITRGEEFLSFFHHFLLGCWGGILASLDVEFESESDLVSAISEVLGVNQTGKSKFHTWFELMGVSTSDVSGVAYFSHT